MFRCFVLIAISLLCISCIIPATERLSQAAVFSGPYFRPVDNVNKIKIHVNQVGYEAGQNKNAVIESVVPLDSFKVISASDESTLFEGNLEKIDNFKAWGGGPFFYIADFSQLSKEGAIKIRVKETDSYETLIGKNILISQTLSLLVDYFKNSRADLPNVLRTDANVQLFETNKRKDIRGGWYDASGDISKYLSHLSYANFMNPQQIPLVAWGLSWIHSKGENGSIKEGLMKKIASEAVWGADYLVRAQSDEGYFYINVFDRWTGEMAERRVCAFETRDGIMTSDWQAALREGGGMSIAALARISRMEHRGEYSSSRYLETAIKGWKHLLKNNEHYCDDGKENIIDDYTALLAAVELFKATKEEEYLLQARTRVENLTSRLHDRGYFVADDKNRPFWHASDAGLPIVSLATYLEAETDGSRIDKTKAILKKHMDYLLEVTDSVPNPFGYARQSFLYQGKVKDGFFIPQENETGYWWQGENARLGSLAAAAFLAAQHSEKNSQDKAKYRVYANQQLSWILGMNPYGLCFLKGIGSNNPDGYNELPNHKNHGDIDGGISNGITGTSPDGSGIAFWNFSGYEPKGNDRWRWLEQWLPHSSWFMIAIVASLEE